MAAKRSASKKSSSKSKSSNSCKCMESDDDGKFYCFKKVQGRYEECQGPFDTMEECIDATGEQCG